MNQKYRNTVIIENIEPQALWILDESLGQFILVDDDQYVAVDFEPNIENFTIDNIGQDRPTVPPSKPIQCW